MTQEEVLLEVLKPRSGYFCGKGTALRGFTKGQHQILQQKEMQKQQQIIQEQEQRIKECLPDELSELQVALDRCLCFERRLKFYGAYVIDIKGLFAYVLNLFSLFWLFRILENCNFLPYMWEYCFWMLKTIMLKYLSNVSTLYIYLIIFM
ncbi:hypothetical protein RIF29_09741 [Crotalaria pallida]|uniref:Uncharacterized protein n=1 Tax=Crotalaria pallida TaxID=3830 RepID=A0AAN9IKM2_CROPI